MTIPCCLILLPLENLCLEVEVIEGNIRPSAVWNDEGFLCRLEVLRRGIHSTGHMTIQVTLHITFIKPLDMLDNAIEP
jgi:hypothetical protein